MKSQLLVLAKCAGSLNRIIKTSQLNVSLRYIVYIYIWTHSHTWQMSTWTTFLLLSLLTLLHILLTLACCCKHFYRRRGSRSLSIQADSEPSPFSPPHLTDDDDEQMLDPSSNNAAQPTLAFAQPSAPVHPTYTSFQPSASDPWSTNWLDWCTLHSHHKQNCLDRVLCKLCIVQIVYTSIYSV